MMSITFLMFVSPFCAALTIPSAPPDSRRLILVRHGAVNREMHNPPIKAGALYGGDLEVPLSELGEAEAVAAAVCIGEELGSEVRLVCSSPMLRAIFGANAIAAEVQPRMVGRLDITTYELLREIGRGQWTNLTRDEIAAQWGDDAFDRCAREDDFGRSVGGEGIGDLRERVMVARDYILKKLQPGTAAVVVSHMWVTRTILADALGESNVLNVDVPTASISVVDCESRPAAAYCCLFLRLYLRLFLRLCLR